ncbi:MAG: hypothetical protein ACK52V_09115 [Betaproteobacteria bacterium]
MTRRAQSLPVRRVRPRPAIADLDAVIRDQPPVERATRSAHPGCTPQHLAAPGPMLGAVVVCISTLDHRRQGPSRLAS